MNTNNSSCGNRPLTLYAGVIVTQCPEILEIPAASLEMRSARTEVDYETERRNDNFPSSCQINDGGNLKLMTCFQASGTLPNIKNIYESWLTQIEMTPTVGLYPGRPNIIHGFEH